MKRSNMPRCKDVVRRLRFGGDRLPTPGEMTISAGETPQLAFFRTKTPPRLLPNRRRGGGDRGREILNEESLADFGGGRFGSPEKRRRFQGSSASPQNLRQTLQTRIT